MKLEIEHKAMILGSIGIIIFIRLLSSGIS